MISSYGSYSFNFNESGDFTKFVALRYKDNELDAKRFPWILTVDQINQFEGIRIPSKMKSTWKLYNEGWTWLELEIIDMKYNENALY